MYLKFTTRT